MIVSSPKTFENIVEGIQLLQPYQKWAVLTDKLLNVIILLNEDFIKGTVM